MKPKTIGSNPMCFVSERASVVSPTKKDKESVKRESNQNPLKLLNSGQESKRETIADLLLGIVEFGFLELLNLDSEKGGPWRAVLLQEVPATSSNS